MDERYTYSLSISSFVLVGTGLFPLSTRAVVIIFLFFFYRREYVFRVIRIVRVLKYDSRIVNVNTRFATYAISRTFRLTASRF